MPTFILWLFTPPELKYDILFHFLRLKDFFLFKTNSGRFFTPRTYCGKASGLHLILSVYRRNGKYAGKLLLKKIHRCISRQCRERRGGKISYFTPRRHDKEKEKICQQIHLSESLKP